MMAGYVTEFRRYRDVAEMALDQVSDDDLNHVPVPDGNSLAMLVRHISGNLRSRFTDFLTSDGEKPWRHRDEEFEERPYARADVNTMWREGWDVLERTLATLTDGDLSRTVRIRDQELTVDAALARSLAHLSYHVGQIVLLARMTRNEDWQWISVPKGQSREYNRNPTQEKSPGGSR